MVFPRPCFPTCVFLVCLQFQWNSRDNTAWTVQFKSQADFLSIFCAFDCAPQAFPCSSPKSQAHVRDVFWCWAEQATAPLRSETSVFTGKDAAPLGPIDIDKVITACVSEQELLRIEGFPPPGLQGNRNSFTSCPHLFTLPLDQTVDNFLPFKRIYTLKKGRKSSLNFLS